MSCDKALRVVTDDGEELLPCTNDRPVHLHHRAVEPTTKWWDGHPAEVTVRRHRPVEPEQPTVTVERRGMAGLWHVLHNGGAVAVFMDEHNARRHAAHFSADVAGEQPLDVEAWKRQAVEVARQAFDKWGRARDDDPRKAHVAVVDALIEAGLAGGAERPLPFDRDEAVEWLVRRTTRVNDGVHAHTGRLHERDARRIVEHFSRLAYPQAPTYEQVLAALVETTGWNPRSAGVQNATEAVMALLPADDKDET